VGDAERREISWYENRDDISLMTTRIEKTCQPHSSGVFAAETLPGETVGERLSSWVQCSQLRAGRWLTVVVKNTARFVVEAAVSLRDTIANHTGNNKLLPVSRERFFHWVGRIHWLPPNVIVGWATAHPAP